MVFDTLSPSVDFQLSLRYYFSMDPLVDDIEISDSHDLSNGPMHANGKIDEEDDSASARALESQGISIIERGEIVLDIKPRSNFSVELMREGGVEILPNEKEE